MSDDPPERTGPAPERERRRRPALRPDRIGPVPTDAFERLGVWLGEEDAPEPAESVAREFLEDDGLGELWSSLEVVHDFLDARLADGEMGLDEVRPVRRHLHAVARHVASAPEPPESPEEGDWPDVRSLLRDVAHDLRSPLNSIVFLVEGLHSGQLGELSESQRRQIGVVYSAATSLLRLVNSLIDWARIREEGGGPEVRFPVGETVEKVRQLSRPIAETRGVELRVERSAEGQYRGDSAAFTRVLVNLVTNALEASDEGDAVELRVEEREGGLGVAVADEVDDATARTGRLRRLFEADGAGDLHAREGDTHGLGIRICSELIDAVGGAARVEPRPEEGGKRIVVLFPFERTA